MRALILNLVFISILGVSTNITFNQTFTQYRELNFIVFLFWFFSGLLLKREHARCNAQIKWNEKKTASKVKGKINCIDTKFWTFIRWTLARARCVEFTHEITKFIGTRKCHALVHIPFLSQHVRRRRRLCELPVMSCNEKKKIRASEERCKRNRATSHSNKNNPISNVNVQFNRVRGKHRRSFFSCCNVNTNYISWHCFGVKLNFERFMKFAKRILCIWFFLSSSKISPCAVVNWCLPIHEQFDVHFYSVES